MLQIRKALCIFLMALLLVQPVFAETEAATETPEPDIVTAVRTMALLPGNWSPLSPKTAEKQWLQQLTTAPLYAMAESGTWTPVLAEALPENVTAAYAGSYGIPADAQRNFAYRILLSADACWEDGTPITADDCLFSICTLLQNPETSENWTFLANAASILDGKRKPGRDIVSLRDAGFSGISDAWAAGYTEFYVDTDGFWGLSGGWKSVSDRIRQRDYAMPPWLDEAFVTPAYLYSRYLMNGAESSYYQNEFVGICKTPGSPLTMKDLGLIKVSDQELVLILQSPATASTLMQQLEALFLFRADRWSEAYGTAVEHYHSYGPYRITSASHQQIMLEPNPNWWGDPDPRGYDRILCQKIGT